MGVYRVSTVPLTVVLLGAGVLVWWLAVRAVAGDRFGVFHWVPVAFAWLVIPMHIAGATFRTPRFSTWLICVWHTIGLVLAIAYVVRRVTSAKEDAPKGVYGFHGRVRRRTGTCIASRLKGN